MKISDLIKQLQESQAEHGDLLVEMYLPGMYPYPIRSVNFHAPRHAPPYLALHADITRKTP